MVDELGPAPIDILLVEDNDDDVVLLTESLKKTRLLRLVHVARDGREALSYLRREGPFGGATRPGMVLLDINMPQMNGFQVLSAMKADPGLKTIPVVMLTTSARDEDVVQSYGEGACSFLSKPVDSERINDVVGHLAQYWSLVAVLPPKHPARP